MESCYSYHHSLTTPLIVSFSPNSSPTQLFAALKTISYSLHPRLFPAPTTISCPEDHFLPDYFLPAETFPTRLFAALTTISFSHNHILPGYFLTHDLSISYLQDRFLLARQFPTNNFPHLRPFPTQLFTTHPFPIRLFLNPRSNYFLPSSLFLLVRPFPTDNFLHLRKKKIKNSCSTIYYPPISYPTIS